jgi:hypothetical protein
LEAGVFKVINSLSVNQINWKGSRRPSIILREVTLECNVIKLHGSANKAHFIQAGRQAGFLVGRVDDGIVQSSKDFVRILFKGP